MADFTISEISLLPIKPRESLVAFASCVIDGWLYIGGIGLHTRPDGNGVRLLYPSKLLPNGKTISLVHPITQSAGERVTTTIADAYEELMQKTWGRTGEDSERCLMQS